MIFRPAARPRYVSPRASSAGAAPAALATAPAPAPTTEPAAPSAPATATEPAAPAEHAARATSAALVTLAALAALAGCATRGVSPAAPAHPAPEVETADASYDWHVLIVAPFGTRLKESTVPLHEVVLFHDATTADPELESKDCYAGDGAPPRFVGRRPEHYLWCFDHDRLVRIEASVSLAPAEAARVFSLACAAWVHGAPHPADRCEGRDGEVGFAGVITAEPNGAAARLSMTLTDPGAGTEPERTAPGPVEPAAK